MFLAISVFFLISSVFSPPFLSSFLVVRSPVFRRIFSSHILRRMLPRWPWEWKQILQTTSCTYLHLIKKAIPLDNYFTKCKNDVENKNWSKISTPLFHFKTCRKLLDWGGRRGHFYFEVKEVKMFCHSRPFFFFEKRCWWSERRKIVTHFVCDRNINEREHEPFVVIPSCIWHSLNSFFRSVISFLYLGSVWSSTILRPAFIILSCSLSGSHSFTAPLHINSSSSPSSFATLTLPSSTIVSLSLISQRSVGLFDW